MRETIPTPAITATIRARRRTRASRRLSPRAESDGASPTSGGDDDCDHPATDMDIMDTGMLMGTTMTVAIMMKVMSTATVLKTRIIPINGKPPSFTRETWGFICIFEKLVY